MHKYKRHLQSTLMETIKNSPASLLLLEQDIGKGLNLNYLSFDDLFAQGSAEADPIGFVNAIKKPIILDEVQCAPKIFLPLKKDINQHRLPGRYLLTGSANPLVIPKLEDSLAGRMQILQLWPLSQGELIGKKKTLLTVFLALSSNLLRLSPSLKSNF